MIEYLISAATGSAVTLIGCAGYIKAKLIKEQYNHDRLYDNLHAKYVCKAEENVQLSTDYKEMKQELGIKTEQLKARNKSYNRLQEELEGYKEEYKITGNMYDELKRQFKELADEHNELKEKHAPFASLNPFEQQAVSAMTNQSVYNEWLNGAPKEVK
jgi:predicted nuclease with TOPRIM domain